MPIETTVATLLRSILHQQHSQQKFDFLTYLLPKSVPTLARKLEKNVQRGDQDNLNRAMNALQIMRYFLVGFQIDASHFHGALDPMTRVLPFLSEDQPLRQSMLELIQVCMSIHSGHPEKYEEAVKIIEAG